MPAINGDCPAAGRVNAHNHVPHLTHYAHRLDRVRSISWVGLTLLLLALLAALPLWTGPGIVNTRGGGDSPFLFFRVHQLVANLREGVFPARWMPDAAYGLGYPFFNYYASLPYYLAALFNLIGFDLLVSIKLVQTLGFVFAAGAMLHWADRHVKTRSVSWLIAVAYTVAPYHLINVYVRGDSLSEFYAFIFYPLILWSIDRVFESPRSFGWLALSYGGLIVTHNVSALIFSPFALLYVASLLFKSKIENLKSKMGAVLIGFVFAFALSAWFWLPALGEANLVQLDNQTTGYFNYAEHFRGANLVQNSLGFDYAITVDAQSNTPFAMGFVQAIATAAGLLAALITWRRSSDKPFRAFALIGLLIATLMITPLSKPLWDTLPLLPLTQFPWRFLSIQAFFGAMVIGYLASCILHSTLRLTLSFIFGLTLVASVLLPLHPDYLPIRADEITPARLQLYEAFTGNIGTTIRAEYLPRTMLPRPYTGPQIKEPSAMPLTAIVSGGVATSTQLERHTARQIWTAKVNSDQATLIIPITYWPGWTAAIDGQTVPIGPAPDLGTIQIEVPRGEHHIDLQLGRTPLEQASEWLSLLAMIGLLIWSGVVSANRRAVRMALSQLGQHLRRDSAVHYGLLMLGWAVLLIAITQFNLKVDAHSIESMDFANKPWLHHNPDGIDFGSAQLMPSEVTIENGDLVAKLFWRTNSTELITATVSLELPATHLYAGPSAIVQHVVDVKPGLYRYRWSVPYELPTGLYYFRIQIGSQAEYLSPLWIKHIDREPSLPRWGKVTRTLAVAAVQTRQVDRARLEVKLNWANYAPIAANYALSLRLRDRDGKVWTSLDAQPGYGFLPTSLWGIDTINDVYALTLPDAAPRDAVYGLDVIVYRVASLQEVGRVAIEGVRLDGTVSWHTLTPPVQDATLPVSSRALDVMFGDAIKLTSYALTREGDQLKITLAWHALRDIDTNYKVFVHVFDSTTEKIVAQSDAGPRHSTYPTSIWSNGETIIDPIEISLRAVPPGTYRVAIGLYNDTGRLPVSGANVDAAHQRVVLTDTLETP